MFKSFKNLMKEFVAFYTLHYKLELHRVYMFFIETLNTLHDKSVLNDKIFHIEMCFVNFPTFKKSLKFKKNSNNIFQL